MKFLAWMLVLFMSLFAYGQENFDQRLKRASELFSQGKYLETIDELNEAEKKILNPSSDNKSLNGLIAYWRGISYNRLQDYAKSIPQFELSLSQNYRPEDLHYEYGQALFAAEKLSRARIQFRESVKRKFKRAVSLYYIAYISKEMGEKKKAVSFYRAIEKLPPEETHEVLQAAQMQISDVYLEQAEKHPDAFKAVENTVIPQYQRALKVDMESSLAPVIKEKIIQLQQKYDLVLFKLRNGRPTLIPPYFLRFSEEIGNDSNVTFSPQETTVAKSKQSSLYSKTDMMGRYTIYHRNYLSIAPELRLSYSRYFNRVPEIYRNDNYLIAPAVRTAFEHNLWNRPATTLFDYDFNYSERDVNAEKTMNFSSRSHSFMIGEKFNYFSFGESTIRLRQRLFQSYNSSSDSGTTSLIFEQVKLLEKNLILFYASIDRTRVDNSLYDTNAMTGRIDYIVSKVGDNWFTPTFGLAVTTTDPINNRSARGREWLINPNARISKVFQKSWRGNLKFDYQNNRSKDTENFAYKKFVYAFELEYLF